MANGEDQSALRMREATFAAGVWLTYVVCGSGAIYVALTWTRPNRSLMLGLFAAAIASAVLISALPRERIVRSRYREVFFFAWSLVDLILIVLVTDADGGTGSPLALVFFIPVVFSAMSYPLGSVAVVAGLSVVAYMGLALGTEGAAWSYQALFSVMLLCTGAMSAWQARNHDRQRSALMEVSRADPLTGCLNRRGFEERALAEIATAERRGSQGAVLLLDLCGEEIPQASRIMLVADAFDAITSTRPYHNARSVDYACEELERHAGTQFDPECVHALLMQLGADSVSDSWPFALAV